MSDDLLIAEEHVLDMFLAGDHPNLELLRDQRERSIVAVREHTGVGFYSRLVVAGSEPRLSLRRRIVFGDVYAEVDECPSGCGFLLFIEDGLLNMLECFSCEDAFRKSPTFIRFYYGVKGNGASVLASPDRDFAAVYQLLSAECDELSNA